MNQPNQSPSRIVSMAAAETASTLTLKRAAVLLILCGMTTLSVPIAKSADLKAIGEISANRQTSDRYRQLVDQLGSPNYYQRKSAAAKLLEIGSPAIDALKNGVTQRDNRSPDQEIRMASRRLLVLIQRKSRAERTEKFIASGEDPGLAGWGEFSKIVGDQRPARKLFTLMHQATPKLLSTAVAPPSETPQTISEATQRRRSTDKSSELQTAGTIASIVFVSILSSEQQQPAFKQLSLLEYSTLLKQLGTESPLDELIQNANCESEIKKLLSRWLTAVPTPDSIPVQQKLATIDAFELSELEPQVYSIAADAKQAPLNRAIAITVLAQIGNENSIEQLEKLFDAEDLVTTAPVDSVANSTKTQKPKQNDVFEGKLCDFALAAAIKISGNEPMQYGLPPDSITNEKLVPTKIGFTNQDNRNDAFAQWEQTIANEKN